MTGAQLGALMLGLGRTLRRDAIASCVYVRRTLEGACCVHATLVPAIGEDSLMMKTKNPHFLLIKTFCT